MTFIWKSGCYIQPHVSKNALGKQQQANFNGFIYHTVNKVDELFVLGLIFILAEKLVHMLYSF